MKQDTTKEAAICGLLKVSKTWSSPISREEAEKAYQVISASYQNGSQARRRKVQ